MLGQWRESICIMVRASFVETRLPAKWKRTSIDFVTRQEVLEDLMEIIMVLYYILV